MNKIMTCLDSVGRAVHTPSLREKTDKYINLCSLYSEEKLHVKDRIHFSVTYFFMVIQIIVIQF